MTYKLPPDVEKILSPVVLLMPDGTKTRFGSGKEAVGSVFDRKVGIRSLRVAEDAIEIQLDELDQMPVDMVNEAQGFF